VSKKLKQNIFITISTMTTIALIAVFAFDYRIDNWIYLLIWCVLATVSETFLINSPSGVSTSVGVAIYIYVAIMSNPLVVMIVIIVAFLARFPEEDGVKKHLFKTKKTLVLFNLSNNGISMGISAIIIRSILSTRNIHEFNLFWTIIAVVIALIVAEGINFVFISVLLKINQGISPLKVLGSMLKTFSSTIAIGMLGIFLAFAHDNYKIEIVLLFFVPLLLARYSFKLYFESQRMALDTIHALNEALHAKDAYTGGHTGRVELYAVELAKAYGLPTSDCELIKTAALLHDIGKIGVPDDILNKPGKLTEDEYLKIQDHSTIGAKILGNVDSLKKVSKIIVQHHERFDGSGYPSQLKGDEITIEASILMISDSYDAMTTDRPYRKALSKSQAISELVKFSGTQFHPMLTQCFVSSVLTHVDMDTTKISYTKVSKET